MRRRPCAASSPSAKWPWASRSKATPKRSSRAMASGAAAAMRLATAGSLSPSPAARVSAACSAGSSPSPTAAATPPCAQAEAAPWASGVLAIRITGCGASRSAVMRPARPPPMMTGAPANSERIVSIVSLLMDCQHALDGAAGGRGDGGIDRHLVLHGLERAADLGQGDALHVRAEIARPHEVDAGIEGGDVVAHRAFGHQHDPARLLAGDIVGHRRRRAREVGFSHHLGWALGMGQDHDAGMADPELAHVGGTEALVDLAVARPGHDLDLGFG